MAKYLMPQAPLMYGEDYIYPLTRAEQVVLSDGTRLEKNGVLSIRTSDGGSMDPLAFYPIGSIYLSVDATNPGVLFGGVWEQIKDKFMLAAGDTYVAGSTGGEAEHTLTVDEMPIHGGHLTENNNRPDPDAVTNGDVKTSVYFSTKATANGSNYGWVVNNGNEGYPATLKRGGDQPHNNMPPYLAVYMWKRVG